MPADAEKKEGYCLGIESSADDFGVGVAAFNGEILANKSDSYIPAEGGIHPREAARHHAEVADKVVKEALTAAGVKPRDLSIIAFSQGPGLGPSLRTGATVARALASYLADSPRRRQPFRSAHRNRKAENRRRRPSDPLRFRRQHHGNRFRSWTLQGFRRNTGHRAWKLPGCFRAGSRSQEPQRFAAWRRRGAVGG